MAPHLIFFMGVLAFLSGIIFSSLGLSLAACLVPAAILLAALLILRFDPRVAALAALLMLLGSFYYLWNDYHYRLQVARLPQAGDIQGMISDDPVSALNSQSFDVQTSYGKMFIQTGLYPAYAYGDTITVRGSINPPGADSYGRYLAKENIVGTWRNPDIRRTSQGGGNKALAFLFRIKNGIRGSFKSLLAPDEAALISGITLGANQDISKTLLQDLAVSGVRHLTAINGLHMSIVFFMLLGALAYVLPRRYAFIFASVAIVIFTALTGFAVSAIRAALMAFIAGLAKEAGRFYSAHNALALAALILALLNPKVLVFDAGFQLSFLAVFGIIYFLPVLRRMLSLDGPKPGAWREVLLITFSAQIMTAPVLITQFQNFSLTAFLANMLILWMLPVVMLTGFLTGFLAFLFRPLAVIVSFILAPLARYIILVAELCARLAVLFNPALGLSGVILYYALLIFVMYRFSKPLKTPINSPIQADAAVILPS